MPFDQERLRQRIAGALEKIYSEADPKLLNQYRAVIKQEVSLFKRSYLTAYLLMEQDQGGRRARAPVESGKPEAPRRPLPEEESVRLFVGAGRSRRIFPREVLALIAEKTSAAKDDIGIIRILDNYSFIQVRKSVADEIISALNGSTFRGRPLAVNYARPRKDESPERPDRARRDESPERSERGRGRGRDRSRPREDENNRNPDRETGRNRENGRNLGPERDLDDGENGTAAASAFDHEGGLDRETGRGRAGEFGRDRGLDSGLDDDRRRDFDDDDDLDSDDRLYGDHDDDLDDDGLDRSLDDNDDLNDEIDDDGDLGLEDALENGRRHDDDREREGEEFDDFPGDEEAEYSGDLPQEDDDHTDEEGVKTDPNQ
jgi:hypothetical protein